MKCKGATRLHIIQQFLTETVVLTGSGGVLGVLFGLMCGPLSMSPDMFPPIRLHA